MEKKPTLKKSTNQGNEEEKVTAVNFNSDAREGEVFELLAGYMDENGVVHKTFTIREMTGRDEEAVSKPDIKENGSKVIATLLERCVLSVGTLTRKELGADKWKDIIKGMLVPDQDYALLKVRADSLGNEIEVNHICPECGKKMKSFIGINELDIIPFHGRRTVPFELPKGYVDKKGTVHKTGTMRMTTGLDREILTPMAVKNMSRANTVLLTRLCTFDDDTIITEDTMSDLTMRDREYLLKLMADNWFGVKTDAEITCTNCGRTFSGKLNATNFI